MIGTDANIFGRVMTAMITPFDDDMQIDFKALEKVVEHLLKTGTDSLVVSGTTGESPTLDEAEKKELLKTVISLVKGRAKIIMGTGSNDTTKSIRASQEAEDMGADGLLVVAPYYNKPSQEGLLAHFQSIGDATGLPFILYNIPGRTGVNVTAETLLELTRRCSNLYAIKDSTGSVEQAAEVAGKARTTFRVYSGDDYLTLPFLSIGACGVVSVASHLIGKQLQEMIQSFYSGNSERARQLHYQWLPVFKGLFTAPNPTCVKYALSKLGICKPNLRLPLVQLNAPQREALDALLQNADSQAVTA